MTMLTPSIKLLPSQVAFITICEATLATSPLLTITGGPGIGKSTLLHALHVPGSWHIDLREAHDESDMLTRLASALDLHHEPRRGPTQPVAPRRQQIAEALRQHPTRRLLIDHPEHVHAPLQALLALLEGAPHAQVLIASRRACEEGVRKTPGTISGEEARALLLDLSPPSRRDALERDPESLDQLVQALEHNLLAIKVCAPRLGLFKPLDILKRLTRAHTSSTYDTLQQAFAWSWELLDEPTRQSLAQCAVFVGWFDAALAHHVLGTDTLARSRDTLELLHDHSLIERQQEPHTDEVLFRLSKPLMLFLESTPALDATISAARAALARAVAATCLNLHTHTLGNRWCVTPALMPPTIARHIMPCMRWWQARWAQHEHEETLTSMVHMLLGASIALWMNQDFSTLHALHTFIEEDLLPHPLFASLSPELRIRLRCTHADYFTILYSPQAALDCLAHIPTILPDPPPHLELLWLLRLAELEPQHLNDQAQAHVERGITLATALGEDYALAELLLANATIQLERRAMREALTLLEDARVFNASLANKRPLARVLIFLGFALHEAGQQHQGNITIDRARAAFIAHGDVIGAAHALRVRAWQSVDDQDFAQSKALIDDMLAFATQHGLGWLHAFGFFLLGQHELDQQRYPQALIAYERARYHLERQQMTAMLAASQLYRSICYKLTGDMPMARRIYEEGATHLAHVRATAGQLHYTCELAEWHAFDGERRLAIDTLKKARALLEGCREHDLLSLILEVYQCKIDLFHYFTLRDQQKPTERLYRSILERLSKLHKPLDGSDKKPLASCIEVRLAWALLQRELPEEFLRRFLIEVQDPMAHALILDPGERAYRAPGNYDWVSLGKRENPYNLLLLLVEQHIKRVGEPVDEATIITHLWPDEHIAPDAARNRLYVTLSSLRNSGDLKHYIHNHDGGYMLDTSMDVLEV